jgi:hypothetical protein
MRQKSSAASCHEFLISAHGMLTGPAAPAVKRLLTPNNSLISLVSAAESNATWRGALTRRRNAKKAAAEAHRKEAHEAYTLERLLAECRAIELQFKAIHLEQQHWRDFGCFC